MGNVIDVDNYKKIIESYGIEHPSRIMEWDVLISGLKNEVKLGNVSVYHHPVYLNLVIYKYTDACVNRNKWNIFSLMANGLVLDIKNKKVIATPFLKMFEYNQIKSYVKDAIKETHIVVERINGNTVLMFNYDNKWIASTTKSFTSPISKWSQKWINNFINLSKIDAKNTYIFKSDIRKRELILTGIIDSFGLEYNIELLKLEASYMNVKCVKLYDFNYESDFRNSEKKYIFKFKDGLKVLI